MSLSPTSVTSYNEVFSRTEWVCNFTTFGPCQGTLTEGEGSVQLTSFLLSSLGNASIIYFFHRIMYLNEEVNCTKPSSSVSIPWTGYRSERMNECCKICVNSYPVYQPNVVASSPSTKKSHDSYHRHRKNRLILLWLVCCEMRHFFGLLIWCLWKDYLWQKKNNCWLIWRPFFILCIQRWFTMTTFFSHFSRRNRNMMAWLNDPNVKFRASAIMPVYAFV